MTPRRLSVDRSETEGAGVGWRFIRHRLEGRAGAGGARGRGPSRRRAGRHLLVALALRRGLDNAAFALDGGKRTAVEIVDVDGLPQLADVLDAGGLIRQVDPGV